MVSHNHHKKEHIIQSCSMGCHPCSVCSPDLLHCFIIQLCSMGCHPCSVCSPDFLCCFCSLFLSISCFFFCSCFWFLFQKCIKMLEIFFKLLMLTLHISQLLPLLFCIFFGGLAR